MATKKKTRRRRRRGYFRGTYVSDKTGQHCVYRSGWELGFMMFLDASPDVVTFASEPIKIPYVSNLKSRRLRNYVPDFVVEYIDGSTFIIEIKPKKRLDQATVKKKLSAAHVYASEHGWYLAVLTEVELKELGVQMTGFTRDTV